MGDENTVVHVEGVTYIAVEVESSLPSHAKEVIATCIALKGKYIGHHTSGKGDYSDRTTAKLLIPFNKLNVFWEETKHSL